MLSSPPSTARLVISGIRRLACGYAHIAGVLVPSMTDQEFEVVLNQTCDVLTKESIAKTFATSPEFESRVRAVVQHFLPKTAVNLKPPAQNFPDIVLGDFGIEVKFTANDTWRSIANSVSEGSRDEGVKQIYLLFGKMGGKAEVRWARYDDCVIHVRTSHVPRFEVEIPTEGKRQSLFEIIGVPYSQFCKLPMSEKMTYIRKYARSRLEKGEHLWWLEDKVESDHSLPIQPRLYTKLSDHEKTQYRAEAVLLCPEILMGGRVRGKYENAVSYLLTYRGVLCYQARDLFTAGSVAYRDDDSRGGLHIQRAIQAIEAEIIRAANDLEDALFEEYWGAKVPKEKRLRKWLQMADLIAGDWKPSDLLFLTTR